MTTTLKVLTSAMRALNDRRAPGSECAEWQDYHADCFDRLGCAPYNDDHADMDVPDDFSLFWLLVAEGNSYGDAERMAGRQ